MPKIMTIFVVINEFDSMFLIIGILVLGVLCGILLRGRLSVVLVGQVIKVIIYLLLLVLGITVGANEQVMVNLGTLGFQAVVISLSAVLVGCVLSLIVYKKVFSRKDKGV